jgi:hypothetical protein
MIAVTDNSDMRQIKRRVTGKEKPEVIGLVCVVKIIDRLFIFNHAGCLSNYDTVNNGSHISW